MDVKELLELLEKISSTGLIPSSIMSSRLDDEFDLTLILASYFLCLFCEVVGKSESFWVNNA
jgi:hypothetical protein